MKEKNRELLEVLEERKYLTGEQLAVSLGVSSKTVRLMIKELNNQLSGHGACIESRHRTGYRLQVEDRTAYDAWLRQQSQREVPSTPEGRVKYILNLLLEERQYRKLDDLSEELYASKTTLSKELKLLEKEIAPYSLKLVRRPNYGIAIEGDEFNIRLCIANNNISDGPADTMQEKQILGAVLHCLDENRLHMSDLAMKNLILHLEIAVERIRKECYVSQEGWEEWLTGDRREYQIAGEIVREVEKLYEVHFPEPEVAYVAVHLAGKQVLVAEENSNVVISPEISELVTNMLELVRQGFCYDFREDLELRMNLSQHLLPLLVRLRHNLVMKNPLLKEIKEKYALAYAVACQAVIAVEQHAGKSLKEDETAYFALLFALALERKKVRLPAKIFF